MLFRATWKIVLLFFVALTPMVTSAQQTGATVRGVVEEKTNRVAEVVVSSVKPDTMLAGMTPAGAPPGAGCSSRRSGDPRARCTYGGGAWWRPHRLRNDRIRALRRGRERSATDRAILW